MEWGVWGNGEGQDLGEDERAKHAADGTDAVDGALELALRSRIDATRHQRRHGRPGDAPKTEEGNGAEKCPAMRGERETEEAESAEDQAGQDATAFAEAADEGAD